MKIRLTLLAATAAIALIGALVVWHWLVPPDPTFTKAQIEAASARRDNFALRKAIEDGLRTTKAREADMAAAKRAIEKLTMDLEAARALTKDARTVVLPADDPWLRAGQKSAR